MVLRKIIFFNLFLLDIAYLKHYIYSYHENNESPC